MPALRFQVTSIPEPTSLTPPLSTVGTFAARLGTYLRSGVMLRRLSNMLADTSLSVGCFSAKYGLTVSGSSHSARTTLTPVVAAGLTLYVDPVSWTGASVGDG